MTWDWDALYRQARRMGLSSAQFWSLTPGELAEEFAIARERDQERVDMLVAAAWFTEWIRIRVAKERQLRPLVEYLMSKQKPVEPQTPKDMLTAMHQIAADFGIPMTRKES